MRVVTVADVRQGKIFSACFGWNCVDKRMPSAIAMHNNLLVRDRTKGAEQTKKICKDV